MSKYDVFEPAKLSPSTYEVGQVQQAPDIASQITREHQLGLQRDARYYQQFERDDKIAEANRKREQNKLDQVLKQQQKDFEQLSAFSDKIAKVAFSGIEGMIKANETRGQVMAFNNGQTPEQVAAFNEQLQAANALNGEARTAAIKELHENRNAEVALNLRSLGDSETRGFVNTKLDQLKGRFANDLPTMMRSDNETVLVDPNGIEFTPATAKGDVQVQMAAMATYGNLLQDYGLSGVNPAYLEMMFNQGKGGARETIQKTVTNTNKFNNINRSQAALQQETSDQFAQLRATGQMDMNAVFQTSLGTLNNNGEVRTFDQAWKKTDEIFTEAAKNGLWTAAQIKDMAETTTAPDGSGESWAKRYPRRVAKYVAAANKHVEDVYTAKSRQETREAAKLEDALVTKADQMMESGVPFTRKDYESYQAEIIRSGGKWSSRLERLYKMNSSESENRESNEAIILSKHSDMTLRPQDLLDLGDPELYKRYIGDARRFEQADAATNGFKTIRTAVEGTVRSVAKGLGVNDALPWTAKLVTDDLMKQIRTRTNALLQDPKYANNPTAAANAAMAEVMAAAAKDGLTAGATEGRYADGLKGNFPTFMGEYLGGVKGDYAAAEERRKKFEADTKKYGLEGVDDKTLGENEQPYVSTADLEVNGENYDALNWKPLPQATDLVRQFPELRNALEATNRLRASRGLPELPPPPSLKPNAQTTTPQAQQALRALTLAHTPDQVVRAGSQMGEFNPAMVPYGHGEVVVSAATSNGVPPIEAAAIAGVETQFRDIGPGHPDYNGEDNGMFQVNKNAHPNYDYVPGDVQGNANYGMQVFADMKREAVARGVLPQYQRDFAFAAYNAGPNAIPIVDGVPQWTGVNKDYLTKIHKQLGRFGDSSSYGSQWLMRPGFARQVTHVDTGTGYTTDGAFDASNRPVVLAEPALMSLSQLVETSGGVVKWSDITSAQRSPSKNVAVGGVSNSQHLSGNAVDYATGTPGWKWLKEHGPKYGWYWNDYMGPNGWHFDYDPNRK